RCDVSASVMSRRLSEVLGVALFAAALLWFVALASYSPADPAWFFYAGPPREVENFAGPVGAFVAECAFQLLGYASFLVPVVLLVAGWHYFWCRTLSAGATKAVGAAMLLLCGAALLALALGETLRDGRAILAGGHVGALLADAAISYLSRTGSAITIFAVGILGFLLTTQVSLGELFASAAEHVRQRVRAHAARIEERREARRRDAQRREVIQKHLDKGLSEEEVQRVTAQVRAADVPRRGRGAAAAAVEAPARSAEPGADEPPPRRRERLAARAAGPTPTPAPPVTR